MKLLIILVASLVSLAYGRSLQATRVQTNPVEELAKENTCKDGKMCEANSTCCGRLEGASGCCAHPNAVCCSDGLHCCPAGYKCHTSSNTCLKENSGKELMSDLTSIVSNVVCPGGTSQCPDGNTCCKLSSGQWGCCPLPNAVCCSDGQHCCPSGYTCDVSAGTCTRGNELLQWSENSLATLVKLESVVCPGGTSYCPDGNTCCQLASGQWGCCPIPNAVCCSDHTHCCPSGYTCDTSQGTCTRGENVLEWSPKSPAIPMNLQNVVCPGGSSECPDGNTCCKLSSGQWGCCPLPNAVCCSDGQHCCPSGYTCDVSAGTCSRGNEVLQWFKKSTAVPRNLQSVICPDGTSECPDGNTCCKLSSGQWGCCPLPNAVCCSDGQHCCPSGYTCDVSAGTCSRGNELLQWSENSLSTLVKLESVVCPGGTSYCPDGNTCCQLASGQWGCCPIPNAVCCSDHTHCCPSGYTCDTSQGTCTRGENVLEWSPKSPAIPMNLQNVVCPGGSSGCPDGNTCCKLSSGQWGCCPLPNAVCCSDGQHCCPSGYTCDVSAGTCSRGNEVLQWSENSLSTPVKLESVVCPGGTSYCPDGNTCCQLASGQWGCCPIPNAVCCSDHTHCCPSGYTCDTSQGTCTRGEDVLEWSPKSPAIPMNLQNVVCPGGSSECPDGNTCCKLSSGQWGCCPLPNAVCCSDGQHCCPSGYTCDVSAGTCSRGNEVLQWFKKSTAAPINLESVICPDGTSECPDGNTCCKLSSGQWGCCPLPNAVCCSDGQHCCPSGYTCDVSAGTCSRGNELLQWSENFLATLVKLESVVCPGGTSYCPDGNTCCQLASGQWECCPIPNAVCCSDHTHCCPSGYTCDTSQGTCTRGENVLEWSPKSPAIPMNLQNVVCPGGSSECPDGNTCCKLSSGQWGCCPLPNAVCCSDGQHCCPSGYTCDVSAGTCSRGNEVLQWFKKSTAAPINLESVICPDGTSECPDGNTCCKLSSGQWGCCPLPNAVCCSDGQHCCPSGYTCDVSAGTCSRGNELLQWSENFLATLVKLESVVGPGGTSYCPDGNTCCQLASGQWGCCPIPNAVCCSDHTHCCPSGYTCDTSQGTCTRGEDVLEWSPKSPAIPMNLQNVVCPGGSSECPDGNTCCKLSSGQWGCCPLPNAVCCSDGQHCCPSGYTCDVSAGTCSRGNEVLQWFKKSTAAPINLESVICPDGTSECPDGNTCCKLSSGQWGCCPLPNAVCCSDGQHCCPSGYTCDVSAGTCSRGNELLQWSENFLATLVKLESVVCPGGTSYCPDGNTCCQLASGQWGCCPIPNAVCCSDHTHCCPSGYTCDTSQGTCTRGEDVLEWSPKSPAIPMNLQNVVCPGGSSECPDGNTCCKLSSGQWGCCPLPNAVCCSDGQHCCPSGYTCDVSAGTCSRGNEVLQWFKKSTAAPINLESVICPDGTSECPDGNTCCKLSSGQWGCCPLPNAVCCSDGQHCCPSGYTCDVSAGTCSRGNELLQWSENFLATLVKLESVVCPGGTSYCPDGNTCCQLASGQWGCCPIPNAVCCSDHTHCCPSGYTCDTSQGTCTRGEDVLEWSPKSPAIPMNLQNVVCPGGSSECPDGNTCCKLSSGQWGCCPLPNAVCCSDGQHCCPSGYTCDVSAGTCSRGNEVLQWFKKSTAAPINLESVICPDGTSECPDGNTCCKLSSGQWGCCPLPNAVCCSDGQHCCPSGYTCDVSAGTCSRGNELLQWSENFLATLVKLESVVCPGGTSYCPDGNTCCQLASGQWGCCPIPNAVCCSDHTHCCPSGYTCDTSQGTCTRGEDVLEWSPKSPAIPMNLQNVVCPGGSSECPDGNTCCKLSSGQWGCCPLPNAVCCSDGQHCCPSGYTCDVSAGTCSRGNEVLQWFKKSTAAPINLESVICPDGTSECPDGNTCCKLSSGQWGCCPLPNAVCCSDGQHCCPSGYTCDVSAGTCSRGNEFIQWFKKSTAAPINLDSVICPDGTSECPDGNTCCKLSSGQWGCCPLPNAVCCSDGEHCCPSGYTCDTSAGTCTRGNDVLSWFEKSPVVSANLESVVCPGGTAQCPDGNTCCKLPSGQWGCCPLPNAVCCSDGEHCCPAGYTCDVSAGTCLKGNSNLELSSISNPHVKVPTVELSVKKSPLYCSDGKTSCPSSSTCCPLMASGKWGCCPVQNAVCCDDHIHCCPSGYSCGTSSCQKGSKHLPLLTKATGLLELTFSDMAEGQEVKGNDGKHLLFEPDEPQPESARAVICPDGQSECPDGNTCCQLTSGQYGCCPLPQAVCCADKEHCCPSGYTCDPTTAACTKEMHHLPWLIKAPSTPLNARAAVKQHTSGDHMCPSQTQSCPDGSTCCQTPGGIYGCCPYEDAICCSDLIHCCPSGYECNVSTGTCSKDDHVMLWGAEIPNV